MVPEGIFLTDGTTLPALYGLHSGKNNMAFADEPLIMYLCLVI